jgi:quercetin dioxygenase-like cupin family protein
MKHMKGRADNAVAAQREGTFTGQVWGDPLMPTEDGVTMNTVYFAPGARTYWHKHAGGQVIHISSGEGFVAERGKAPTRVRKGDTVWAPPDEEHWHGAAEDTFLVHVAVSLGKTEWFGEATDDELHADGEGAGSDAAGAAK